MNHAPLPEQERYLEQASVRLRGLSPREVAMLIRSLDSRLTGISYQQQAGEQLLIYTFEVAGKVQSFQVAVTPDAIEADHRSLPWRGDARARSEAVRPDLQSAAERLTVELIALRKSRKFGCGAKLGGVGIVNLSSMPRVNA